MSKFANTSLFKNTFFWIISLSLVVALLIIFASPYLFESMQGLTLRLFIAFIVFFGTLVGVLLYTLFVKDEVKKKLRERKEQMQQENL